MATRSRDWIRNKLGLVLNNTHTAALRSNLLRGFPLWVASLITGFLAIVYTTLFGIAESAFHYLKDWNSYSVFVITPLCFTAAYLLVRYTAPYAKGSGIPQVMASLEVSTRKQSGIIDELLGIRIILAKIFSSLLMVQGGGAIGREGPTIQIASSIFRITERYIPKSWPKLSSQSYIITGAAAGLAAAFNTPLGGIVFAIEELSKIHIRFFRTSLFVAVIIAGLTAQGILGSYLYLGYPVIGNTGIIIFLPVLLVAVLSGVAGAVMSQAILWVRQQRRQFNLTRQLVFTILAGVFFACLGFIVDESIYGTGKDLMNRLLFSDNKESDATTMLFRMLGPVICFNTGAAGGVFAPSLAAGASVGGWVSDVFHYTAGDANILILCGMVGFLTGVTRTPFTSAILVLEMTDRHGVIFHLMLAALVANVVAMFIQRRSLYEVLKEEYVGVSRQ